MTTANLKLYVRGFFGSEAMATETTQTWKSRPLLSVFDLTPEAVQHVVANESIVEVYNQVIRRQVIHTDFDFRERVVRIALRAFGVNNFALWVQLQKESPTFTQTHADFIADTLKFITSGKRDISVDTWEKIVGPGSNDPVDKPNLDLDMLATAENSLWPSGPQTEATLHHVITRWLSQPRGFIDLVTSLYTLFGEHNTR